MQGLLIRQGVLDPNWKVVHNQITEANDWDTPPDPTGGMISTGYNDAGFILNIDPVRKIRTKWFGQNNQNLDATLFVKGFYGDGLGQDIGSVALKTGNVQINPAGSVVANMHPSVREQFTAGTWFHVDTHTITAIESGILSKVDVGDGTSFLDIDVSQAGYRSLVLALQLPGVTPMTAAFGLYVPLL